MIIAIIGTGLMGTAMAEALMSVGHEIIAYNRTASRTAPLVALGAKAAATPADAIAAADASVVLLPDADSVHAVLLSEATKTSLKGKKLLNASTTKPEEIVLIAREVAENGGSLAEVSIMVGADELRGKQGQFVLGSSVADEDFWTELLRSIGVRVNRAGDVGDASKAETPILIVSMFGIVTAAYAVAVALKLNIPKEICEHYIPMMAPGSECLMPNLLSRNYDECMASIDNFAIVSATAVNAAQSLGLPIKVLESIHDLFVSASERGLGQKDGTAVCEVLLEPESRGV